MSTSQEASFKLLPVMGMVAVAADIPGGFFSIAVVTGGNIAVYRQVDVYITEVSALDTGTAVARSAFTVLWTGLSPCGFMPFILIDTNILYPLRFLPVAILLYLDFSYCGSSFHACTAAAKAARFCCWAIVRGLRGMVKERAY